MKDLSFAFSRTVSRLREMGSGDYLEVCKTHPAAQSQEDYKSIVSKVDKKDG
jgi:predicted ATPase